MRIGGGASIADVAIDMTSLKTSPQRAFCRSLTARLFAFSKIAAWATDAELWPTTRASRRRGVNYRSIARQTSERLRSWVSISDTTQTNPRPLVTANAWWSLR